MESTLLQAQQQDIHIIELPLEELGENNAVTLSISLSY